VDNKGRSSSSSLGVPKDEMCGDPLSYTTPSFSSITLRVDAKFLLSCISRFGFNELPCDLIRYVGLEPTKIKPIIILNDLPRDKKNAT
jgi:hypothetical protein